MEQQRSWFNGRCSARYVNPKYMQKEKSPTSSVREQEPCCSKHFQHLHRFCDLCLSCNDVRTWIYGRSQGLALGSWVESAPFRKRRWFDSDETGTGVLSIQVFHYFRTQATRVLAWQCQERVVLCCCCESLFVWGNGNERQAGKINRATSTPVHPKSLPRSCMA